MRDLLKLKKLLTLALSAFALYGSGFDYLNEQNKGLFQTQKEINKRQSQNLKNSWIEPIVASYTYTNGKRTKTKYFKVSLTQPVFKSGGIYFAIKYADANKKFLELSTSISENQLIKRVYELVLNLKKLDLQLKQTKLKLKNTDYEIQNKQDRFLSGDDDISFLDRAMLEKNTLLLQLEQLKTTHKKLESSFNNISNYNYHDIKLPSLELVSKERFITKNLELQKVNANISQKNELKNMTISNYLPTVSLFYNYNYQKTKVEPIDKWQKNSFKNYGVTVSMPFSINESRDMEIKKLEVLKAKLELSQKKRELKNEYQSVYLDMQMLKRKKEITNKSIKLYKRLVKTAYNSYKAGDKTKFDYLRVKNSMKSLEEDLRILDYDMQLEILKLFEKMSEDL